MSETAIEVHIDLDGTPRRVGRLWARRIRGRESATFEYAEEWLADPQSFALEPALALGRDRNIPSPDGHSSAPSAIPRRIAGDGC